MYEIVSIFSLVYVSGTWHSYRLSQRVKVKNRYEYVYRQYNCSI